MQFTCPIKFFKFHKHSIIIKGKNKKKYKNLIQKSNCLLIPPAASFFFNCSLVRHVLSTNRVSKSHGLTIVWPRKVSMTLRKTLRFACGKKKTLFIKWFLVMFLHFFLAQNFKTYSSYFQVKNIKISDTFYKI